MDSPGNGLGWTALHRVRVPSSFYLCALSCVASMSWSKLTAPVFQAAGHQKGQRRQQGSEKPAQDPFKYILLEGICRKPMPTARLMGKGVFPLCSRASPAPNSITVEEGLVKWERGQWSHYGL